MLYQSSPAVGPRAQNRRWAAADFRLVASDSPLGPIDHSSHPGLILTARCENQEENCHGGVADREGLAKNIKPERTFVLF
jgi:hypothetical protein